MPTKKEKSLNIVLRPGFKIGEIDAALDDDFLQDCYINNPEPSFLLSVDNKEVILDGRTGTGKTAAFRKASMDSPEEVISLSPQDLFVDGLGKWTNSEYLSSLGINLEPIYKNIWLGMFAIEVIRHRFPEEEGADAESVWVKFRRIFSQKSQQEQRKAEELLKKLRKWGDGFSDPPAVRLKKITEKVDKQIEGVLKGKIPVGEGKVGGKYGASRTIELAVDDNARQELQHLISDISASEIRDIISLLEDVHDRFEKNTVILIDELDVPWASSRTKLPMIKALVDAACQVNAKSHLRCVLAIRDDLFQLVLEEVSRTGQQREKYRQFRRVISWEKEQLVELVELRIQSAFKRQYTKKSVSFYDVFPRKHSKKPTLDFLISKTLLRPRDVIHLVNRCIQKSQGRASVSNGIIEKAVVDYSTWLRESIEDEWRDVYGEINRTYNALAALGPKMIFDDITKFNWYDNCLRDMPDVLDPISDAISRGLEGKIEVGEMGFILLNIWYEVGLVGVGYGKDGRMEYRYRDGLRLSRPVVKPLTKVQVSPAFEAAFGLL